MNIKCIQGMTLIEVVICIFILSIGLMAHQRALLNSQTIAIELHHKTMAHWAAQNTLLTLYATAAVPDLGTYSHECPIADMILLCQYEVLETQNPLFRKVTVSAIYDKKTLANATLILPTLP